MKTKDKMWGVFKEHPIFSNYLIGCDGRVYSKTRHKYISQRLDKNKRLRVDVYHNGKRYTKFVHQLVAETYIPNPYNLPTVHHIDHDRTNNLWYNLQWVDFMTNILLEKDYLFM